MSRDRPFVSVVTPVYNAEEFIAQCIESVLGQTHDSFELIVVGNCSTDATDDIVRRYTARDSRIRLVQPDEFVGPDPNANRALREISPDSVYTKVVHADDWLFPECLARAFASGVAEARERWGARLRDVRAAGERAVIWGAGSKGVAFLSTLGVADEIACAVDDNPAKHGMFMPGTGHEIVAPAALTEIRPDLVIVMNPVYADEISRDVQNLGVRAEVVAL